MEIISNENKLNNKEKPTSENTITIKNTALKVVILTLSIFVGILSMETFLRVNLFNFVFDLNYLRVCLFSLAYSIIIVFILLFFKQKATIRILSIILILLFIIYFGQNVYYLCVNGFYSFALTGDAVAGLAFIKQFYKNFQYKFMLYLLPIVITIFYIVLSDKKLFHIKYTKKVQPIIVGLVAVIIYFCALSTIEANDNSTDTVVAGSLYNDKVLYDSLFSNDAAVYKFGFLTYQQRDIVSIFATGSLPIDISEEYVDEYLTSQNKESDNDMTGYFEDKNLILITAESFDTYAIHEEITPTLYMMQQEGWNFDNYYSPLYYRSTADTGFMLETSMYPSKNVSLSMNEYKDNYFPNTLPRLFDAEGYYSSAYHNYTDYFYPRSEFYTETLGYADYYGAEKLGLLTEKEITLFHHVWQSDIDLMDLSYSALHYNYDSNYVDNNSINYVDDYINPKTYMEEDQFYTSMLTVSGHLSYTSEHPIASKNYEFVNKVFEDNNEEVNETIKYYLATQYELDQAMELLIKQLTEADKLNDTIIVIFGDHYTYGIDEKIIWEYDDIKIDNDTIDINKIPFIIYNPELESKTISTTMSSVDILPTIANLFNLHLDNNLVMGTDIFQNEDNIIKFATSSFKSNSFTYNIVDDTSVITNPLITSEDILVTRDELITKELVNEWILNNNYFKDEEEN